MKYKFFIPVISSIVIGFLFGKIIFNQYETTVEAFNDGERLYFIELGVYNDEEEMNSKIKNINEYIYLIEDDIYHVYCGITKNKKISEKVKEYYLKNGNNVYVKEKSVSNDKFLNILAEYDKIIDITSSDKDIMTIEKIVLSNYKEMVLENESEN